MTTQFTDAEQRAQEIECAKYNAECAYADALKMIKNFNADYPALALVQMAETQVKILECINFLADACGIAGKFEAREVTHE